jgi:uncharacterized protein (TIGR02996 family)
MDADTRAGFLKALAADEDDEAARLIYADFLEENGEVEEAERQRAWTKAKAWIVRLCRTSEDDDEDDGYGTLDYHRLMRRAAEAVGQGAGRDRNGISRGYIQFGDDERLQDAVRAQKDEFWRHWSTVTGIVLPPGFVEACGYSCAC